MSLIIQIEPPDISGRGVNRALAISHLVYPKTWLSKYRKRHFTERGRTLYGYRKRTRDYIKRKRRLFKHNLPLVFTGRGRSDTQSGRAEATHKRAAAVMQAQIFNIKPKGWPHPMREELTRVHQSEQDEMNRRAQVVADVEFQKLANRNTRKRTIR